MRTEFGELIMCCFDKPQKNKIESRLSGYGQDHIDYSRQIEDVLEKVSPKYIKLIEQYAIQVLNKRYDNLKYQGTSKIEKNIKKIKRMFNLSDNEVRLCTFLFIITSFDPPEDYFSRYLECEKFRGRKYLCNTLNISLSEINEILSSTLVKIGLVEIDRYGVSLSDDLESLFQNPSEQVFEKKFYSKTHKDTIPLNYHFVENEHTEYLLNMLRKKPDTSTHILLYGKPGTGKTSYAYGLVKELGIPSYEIALGSDNITKNRRVAISAALNMTNSGSGAILIVDEADNILSTKFSWFMRGETQDKGYLNQLMEEPGLRIIWICNSIDYIEKSVLRRFAFSLPFKPFSRKQRIRLWETVLKKNRVKRYFSYQDIKNLARKKNINAGTIDLTVKKAIESNIKSKIKFHRAVEISLDAYKCLINNGEKEIFKDGIEKNYTLKGLNIKGNIYSLLKQIGKFNEYPQEDRITNFNILFYGPPGTGKSELAKYIADHLDKEIISKHLSDILSPFVGVAEKNIRDVFEEAEREEAILVLDEADSLLFSREKALRSWEISQTNEFLTAMEKFRGILICTTNMINNLDNASIRRFNLKIEFDCLTPDGKVIFYNKFLSPITYNKIDESSITELKSIANLSPGDFKTIRDRYIYHSAEDVCHQDLIQALKEEVHIKYFHDQKKRIGF